MPAPNPARQCEKKQQRRAPKRSAALLLPCYDSVKSPSFTQPSFRQTPLSSGQRTAGSTKQMSTSPIQSIAPGTMAAAPLARACSLGDSQPVQTPIWPHEAAGAHAGGDRRAVHLQVEHARRNGPGDGGGQRRRNPDAGVFDDVAHLQHRRAQPLGDEAAPAVLPEGHDGEADHLRAAARQPPRRPPGPPAPGTAQMAAEEIGSVSATPTMTETRTPIRNGCSSVAHMTSSSDGCIAAAPMGRCDHQADSATPTPGW